jgi:hypothetical protein
LSKSTHIIATNQKKIGAEQENAPEPGTEQSLTERAKNGSTFSPADFIKRERIWIYFISLPQKETGREQIFR